MRGDGGKAGSWGEGRVGYHLYKKEEVEGDVFLPFFSFLNKRKLSKGRTFLPVLLVKKGKNEKYLFLGEKGPKKKHPPPSKMQGGRERERERERMSKGLT